MRTKFSRFDLSSLLEMNVSSLPEEEMTAATEAGRPRFMQRSRRMRSTAATEAGRPNAYYYSLVGDHRWQV